MFPKIFANCVPRLDRSVATIFELALCPVDGFVTVTFTVGVPLAVLYVLPEFTGAFSAAVSPGQLPRGPVHDDEPVLAVVHGSGSRQFPSASVSWQSHPRPSEDAIPANPNRPMPSRSLQPPGLPLHPHPQPNPLMPLSPPVDETKLPERSHTFFLGLGKPAPASQGTCHARRRAGSARRSPARPEGRR